MSLSIDKKKGCLRVFVMLLGIAIIVVVAYVLTGFIHRSVTLSPARGVYIRITPPSRWDILMSKTRCRIDYQLRNEKQGTVVFFQDFLDCKPDTIIPASDGKRLFCLYETDTDIRLLQVDSTKNFQPFSKQDDLSGIVLSSSQHIESGTLDDWKEVLNYLKTVPLNIFSQEEVTTDDFGIIRLGVGRDTKESLLQEVDNKINYMQRNGIDK